VHHHRLLVLVELDPLNHRVLDPHQRAPYPGARHAVLPSPVPKPFSKVET
jgi:hypothetical protein